MNCVGLSEYNDDRVIYSCQFPQQGGGSVIYLVDQNFVSKIDHFVTILPYNLDLFKTDFFCTVQIKDSCIVDIENRRFYLLFLHLI